MAMRKLEVLLSALLLACGGGEGSKCDSCSTPTAPQPLQPVAWVDGVWTQPVPSNGSPVRLNLPVPLSTIDLAATGGFGAFGAHMGGHVEGLNHIWIPTTTRTIRSWAAGTVTQILDQGPRNPSGSVHEWFIRIDYGQGLVGDHLDVDFPKVTVGQTVKEGDIIADAPSAEFKLTDNRRTDGERSGGSTGASVSPFDYLRDDVKAAVAARYVNEVVTPFFTTGKSIGTQRPWEPLLTNKMLFHNEHKGTLIGEWIMISKSWNVVDPLYYDVMVLFDVSNSYGHFLNVEMEDHDWSLPGNKNHISGTWQSEGPGKIILTLERGAPLYGLYSVDESSGRAKLTLELKLGSYPTSITPNAAVYTERGAVYLGLDAQQLGIVH
jgi:hypothetical protein